MRCPACGAENPENATYCSLCFTRFEGGSWQDHRQSPAILGDVGEGKRILCPNCQELNPVDTRFCMHCGFVFDSVEELLVSAEEAARWKEERKVREEEVFRERLSEPVRVDDGFSGAEIMRRIEIALEAGAMPRFLAKGKNSITHLMKLLALAGEERRKVGKAFALRVRLANEEAMPDLEDVELEVLLEER